VVYIPSRIDTAHFTLPRAGAVRISNVASSSNLSRGGGKRKKGKKKGGKEKGNGESWEAHLTAKSPPIRNDSRKLMTDAYLFARIRKKKKREGRKGKRAKRSQTLPPTGKPAPVALQLNEGREKEGKKREKRKESRGAMGAAEKYDVIVSIFRWGKKKGEKGEGGGMEEGESEPLALTVDYPSSRERRERERKRERGG